MELFETPIVDVRILVPKRFTDERGFFSEVYNVREFEQLGLDHVFVQEDRSYSVAVGTLRGLHFQRPPMAQTKLIRVIRGRIVDVAVDLRPGSPTFGHHVMAELSSDNDKQILIPRGFAHGFITLEPHTEVAYKVDAYWSPEHEAGLHHADPELAIDWPDVGLELTISARDRAFGRLRDLPSVFESFQSSTRS